MISGAAIGSFAYDDVSEGIYRGAAAGLLVGASVVGSAYAYSGGEWASSQLSSLGMKSNVTLFGTKFSLAQAAAVTTAGAGLFAAHYVARQDDAFSDYSKVMGLGNKLYEKIKPYKDIYDTCVRDDKQ
jgi:hypothetical protein